MSQPVLPPVLRAGKKKSRRRVLPWLSDRDTTRAVQIGVLATVLLHLLLLIFLPRFLRSARMVSLSSRPHQLRQMNIRLQPDVTAKPPPRAPKNFVEANPNAPENIPDKTNNFSDRNQQAAQEKPVPKDRNDRPSQVGRKDIASNQIVDGRLTKQDVPAPVTPPSPPKPPTVAVPKRLQDPLAGTEKRQGDGAGFGSNVAKDTPAAQPIDRKVEGSRDAPLVDGPTTTTPPIDPMHPRPRASLDVHARPAIFADNKFGTSNLGISGIDARWSSYGVYLRRLTETVQIEWDNILDSTGVRPQPGSVVEIKFVLNAKGEISKIVNIKSTAGTSEAGTKACESGLTARAPYGPWSEDMIAILGQEQEMTFTFLYE